MRKNPHSYCTGYVVISPIHVSDDCHNIMEYIEESTKEVGVERNLERELDVFFPLAKKIDMRELFRSRAHYALTHF